MNDTLEIGTDLVIDSGSRGPLISGEISTSISFADNWPLTTGFYYILIAVSAGDDINTTNNNSPSLDYYDVVSSPEIMPSAVSLNTGGPYNFSGSGGVLPYTYSINSAGSGVPTIDSSTGAYIAGNSAGTDIVRITDFIGNFSESSVTVTTVVSNVNYDTVSVVNTGGTGGGTPLNGTFTFTNNGTGNGTQTVSWQVYTSLNNTIGAGDELIDSGTTAPLNMGITSAAIPFSGTWPIPVTDTTYYLISEISATDDLTTADNTGNASVLVTVPLA